MDVIGSSGRTRTYNPSVNRGFEATGARLFSATYAEPNGVFGAHSALSFPNFFPKFSAGSAPLGRGGIGFTNFVAGIGSKFGWLQAPATIRICC